MRNKVYSPVTNTYKSFAGIGSFYNIKLKEESEGELMPIVNSFIYFLNTEKTKNLNSRREYLNDFLSAGSLMYKHFFKTEEFSTLQNKIFISFYSLSKKNKLFKKALNLFTNILLTISPSKLPVHDLLRRIELADLKKLINILDLTGKPSEELKLIYDYFALQPEGYVKYSLNKIVSLSLYHILNEKAEAYNRRSAIQKTNKTLVNQESLQSILPKREFLQAS